MGLGHIVNDHTCYCNYVLLSTPGFGPDESSCRKRCGEVRGQRQADEGSGGINHAELMYQREPSQIVHPRLPPPSDED